MTVIAYRDGWMSADSLANVEEVHTHTIKIKRIGNFLVGMAGDIPSWRAIEEWFAGEQPRDRFSGYDFELMIVTPDCQIFSADERGIVDRVDEEYWAIGSGASVAMAVMDCGHSARQGVVTAIKRVPGCGGKVHSLRLK